MSTYRNDIEAIIGCKLPWEKLSHSRILITGATGLIGSCLVETLMANPARDYEVYAMGRHAQRAQQRFRRWLNIEGFHFLCHDVTLPLEGDTTFDYIIHAASNASPIFFAEKPVEVMRANIDGVARLMEYGISHRMRRMLYVSSGEVYGETGGKVLTEADSGYVDCATPRACYPSSKRAAETLCVAYAKEYHADVVIARPCHVYGPQFTEADNRAYAQFIRNVLRGEDIVMKSTGSQMRSWCYVADCVAALLFILLKGESGQAYNVADTTSNISIRQLAQMIAELGGREVITALPDEAEKAGYNVVKASVFSTEKLEALGWTLLPGNMREKMQSTINERRHAEAEP